MSSVSRMKYLLMVVAALAMMPCPTSSQTSSKSIANPDFPCGEPYGPNGESPASRVARQVIFPDDPNYRNHLNVRIGVNSPGPRRNTPSDPTSASNNTQDERFCGGTPISEHFVITAAHCVYDPRLPVSSIHLGDIDLTSDNESNARPAEYEIDVIFAHPDYDPDSPVRYNDVALLRTARPIQFNDVVFPFCISDVPPADGTVVTASGFGLYNATFQPDHLLEANFTVVDPGACEDAYLREESVVDSLRSLYPSLLRNSDIICAIDDVSDACQGDSGGPLFRVKDGKRYLEGIVSGGGSCRGNFKSVLPGLYISVAKHVDFINEHIFRPIEVITP